MLFFDKKILIIGYGSVAKCALPILLRHVDISLKNITILDFADKKNELKAWVAKGVNYIQEKITPTSMINLLPKYVQPGGLVIDLAWNIECDSMLNWCHDHQVLYINTSVEEWDPYDKLDEKTPFQKSLHYRQMNIRKMVSSWQKPMTTAVIDHGANPGLISHFTKQGILDIAQKVVSDKDTLQKDKQIFIDLIAKKDFPQLAMRLGIKVIHISERDTQITNQPKAINEFVGTWSIDGLHEEGIAPAEMGWGTHEKNVPMFASFPPYGPRNQIFLAQMGMNTWVRSWVPNTEIIGMVIRHAEAFSISDYLTVSENDTVIYRPTVHYAYMPCNETLSSLQELRCRNYEIQDNLRIMSDEIIDGDDILGALLMGHQYKSWWTGSMLSIKESRQLVPHQNATTVQVAIGVVSAICWMIENPNQGLKIPDDLPHDYILKIARPYLGDFVSIPVEWTPFKNHRIFFKENPNAQLDQKNSWCFNNFLFRN